jgi:hypothetical protein
MLLLLQPFLQEKLLGQGSGTVTKRKLNLFDNSDGRQSLHGLPAF